MVNSQIIKMGKNPDTVAKLEDEIWGLGDDAYVAALEGEKTPAEAMNEVAAQGQAYLDELLGQ